MGENSEINKFAQENPQTEDIQHTYNFVNIPWDDRTKNSKIGIVSLLIAIFTATVALVIHNLIVHYRDFDPASHGDIKLNCNLVKVDKYPYVARIHSLSSNKMLCLGVVISLQSVLAYDVCLTSGPIRIRLGKVRDPRCKKGFSVSGIDPIHQDESSKKTLVLLSIQGNMKDCVQTTDIETNFSKINAGYIIGRPHRGDKSLSLQIAKITADNGTLFNFTKASDNNTICVQGQTRCPVRISDLLVHDNKILGLASTSVYERDKQNIFCFAKLSAIQKKLKDAYYKDDK